MKTHLCSHRFTQGPLALALAGSMALALAQSATLGPGLGPNPQLPAPEKSGLVPTFNIAPAQGWPQGTQPQAPAGFKVTALARGLDHPRWVYTLPNGDVLVAESNKQPPAEGAKNVYSDGLRGLAMGLVMKRAGAGTPSANRITLLRDTDGDGVADVRTAFMQDLLSPFAAAEVRHRGALTRFGEQHRSAHDSNPHQAHPPKACPQEHTRMTLLIIGLFLFLSTHSARIVADDNRARYIAHYGMAKWKLAYSLVSVVGLR